MATGVTKKEGGVVSKGQQDTTTRRSSKFEVRARETRLTNSTDTARKESNGSHDSGLVPYILEDDGVGDLAWREEGGEKKGEEGQNRGGKVEEEEGREGWGEKAAKSRTEKSRKES